MPLSPDWSDIALRLLCAFAAGAFVGLDRSEHGRAAGLRTSILVCLAACIAMIQVNLLLPLAGRTASSFVMNDLMRLPLGILSGMGFIGGGAILRRDNIVLGVTTASTLWILTVIGLCFGGGQFALGIVGAALALFVVVGLRLIEDRLKRDHQAKFTVVTGPGGPGEDAIRMMLLASGFRISSCGISATGASDRELSCQLHWRDAPTANKLPEPIDQLTRTSGMTRISFAPEPH